MSDTNGQPVARDTREVAIITSDFALVEALQGLPFDLTYRVHAGSEDALIPHILQEKPDVIVVMSAGKFISTYQICEEFKKFPPIPIVLLHNNDYGEKDLSRVSDMDALVPTTYQEQFNLAVEIVRLAFDIPEPRISLTHRRPLKWRLILGSIAAALTGLLIFIPTQDLDAAILSAAAAFSATTGLELATSTRRLRQRLLGE